MALDWLPSVFPILRSSSLPYQLTAPALALLLVFRTEASYSRYEEGRKAWVGIIAGTDDLARQVICSVDGSGDELVIKDLLLRYVAAFPVALKVMIRLYPWLYRQTGRNRNDFLNHLILV